MAYVTKRLKGKPGDPRRKTYYYLAKSVKKNGISCQKILKSLGTADDILAKYNLDSDNSNLTTTIDKPNSCLINQFGMISALYDVTQRLGIKEIIDSHVPKRGQGLPISTYIILAAINRVVAPTSKNILYNWFRNTVLTDLYPYCNENNLSSQSFWNHMVELNQDTIYKIENEITKKVVDTYNIATDTLLFDNTNFITNISTANKAIIPQHGHSKEKRSDLKIVGLSLLVSKDYNMPLFHQTYPGNKNDTKQFADIIELIKNRYKNLCPKDHNITLVFDKGNNSFANIQALQDNGNVIIKFIGSLKHNQCPELLEIPNSNFNA
jgi:transposase